MTFKVGDVVVCKKKFTDGPGWSPSMYEWLGIPMTVINLSPYIKVKENEWRWPESSLTLFSTKSKEEQLSDKITYLYERQQWVRQGKKEALYYIKQVAPSVENKATTEPEITLQSILMGMSIVSGAHMLRGVERRGYLAAPSDVMYWETPESSGVV